MRAKKALIIVPIKIYIYTLGNLVDFFHVNLLTCLRHSRIIIHRKYEPSIAHAIGGFLLIMFSLTRWLMLLTP
jgi:hypothetical protein